MNAPTDSGDARRLLVQMLRYAAELENGLLSAYLYAACSLKSTPQEHAELEGRANVRRAIHFERVRAWKQSLLTVASEEMRHLHYVQCLLRALGEPPHFGGPDRDADGVWHVPNWRIPGVPTGIGVDREGVRIPIDPLDPALLQKFVLYESSNSFQDLKPFSQAMRDLGRRLAAFELELRLESSLLQVPDDERTAMLDTLRDWYQTLPPMPKGAPTLLSAAPALALPEAKDIRFRSIADFYQRGILPLYEQAFEKGWVRHSNMDLNNEMLDSRYAQEGFLPVGPTNRDFNFERRAARNLADPLRNYRNVVDIVDEIVQGGEGATDFESAASDFLRNVAQLNAAPGDRPARAYRKLLQAKPADAPRWIGQAERLRNSHLYRFVSMSAELELESALASKSDVAWSAHRDPIPPGGQLALEVLVKELPRQFNACYLVMLMWLGRMYEVRAWAADTRRRQAIEMLVTWPLMSMAIRPFLELASFVPIDRKLLFRTDAAALPELPVLARQLLALHAGQERSETINAEMDYLALRVLSAVAAWAADSRTAVSRASIDPHAKSMMLARLTLLADLSEFEKQFPFRVEGGYSNRFPDVVYRGGGGEEVGEYAEDPTELPRSKPDEPTPVFKDTLLIRYRFAGRGLVQLATDPDPPLDEAGCTGTHMLHASDGDRALNRALVWQHSDPDRTILREPRASMPALGVNLAAASLMVTRGAAHAGYVPLSVMSSRGAVQTDGVQQAPWIEGIAELATLGEGSGEAGLKVRFELRDREGVKPFLNGANHLVWRDGEPIDPFVLALSVDGPQGQTLPLHQREIFNDGLTLLEMSPLQRQHSARAPVGFNQDLTTIPSWALAQLSQAERDLLRGPNFAQSYLQARVAILKDELRRELALAANAPSRDRVDAAVSLAERMHRYSVPRSTSVGWLQILLHYGHTLSGPYVKGDAEDPVIEALGRSLGLALDVQVGADRNAPNGRWLVHYTKGVMDTDALSDLVYGELYVPVRATAAPENPVAILRAWTFAPTMSAALMEHTCRFARPFWAQYEFTGEAARSTDFEGLKLAERLLSSDGTGYTYAIDGLPNVSSCEAQLSVTSAASGDAAELLRLSWSVRAIFATADVVPSLQALAQLADAMSRNLDRAFAPG